MLNKINISPDRQKLIVYLILTVVTLAVFWQVNQYGFVFDDQGYVTENSHIQSGITLDGFRWAFSTRYFSLWNPLIWLSFMFDYQLHGLNAGGYHLTNLILHVMSALLLFWLFNRMTGAIWKSAFVAALFALHPLHVESVAWIAERKDVLSAFFWMLTLCLYVYYTEKPVIRRYLLVLFCFACALMSKPMVVTLPIVMILLDYWPLDRLLSRKIVTSMPEVMSVSTNQGKKKNKLKKEVLKKNISPSRVQKLSEPRIGGIIPLWQLREKIPFFILSLVLVIITLYNPNTPDMPNPSRLEQFPFISRLANAPVAFVTYLGKTFWPHDMAVLYPFSDQIPLWQVLGASLLILIISVAVIVMVKRLPYLFAGWLWFSITIAPVIGIIQVSITAPYAMADRYHYLPSIGLAVMLAWGIPALIKSEEIRKKLLFPAGIIFLAIISFISWNQCGYWQNSITLYGHTLKVTDDNWRIYYNRGHAYADLGNYRQAIEDLNRAIEIKPDFAEAYTNRGNAYGILGNYRQAIEDLNRAIEINPDNATAYMNRGVAYYGLGNYSQAIGDYDRAIKINPDNATAYLYRGNAYKGLGNYKQSIEDYDRASKIINPNNATAYMNRGNVVYSSLGNHSQAIEDYDKEIKSKPDFAEAYINRGNAYKGLGNYSQAIGDYDRAIKINPDNATAYINRGIAYYGLGNLRQAIKDCDKAIKIKPDYAEAYYNRAIVYLNQSDNISYCRDARKACEFGNCKLLESAKGRGLCR
jgi:protein O-mannosyl-transferase